MQATPSVPLPGRTASQGLYVNEGCIMDDDKDISWDQFIHMVNNGPLQARQASEVNITNSNYIFAQKSRFSVTE